MLSIKQTGSAVLLMALVLSIYACKGEAMWPQSEKVCVFSTMEGTLTFQGKPAVGAKVVREIEWYGNKEKPDTVVTDEAGRFAFPVMNRVLRRFSLREFVAFQDIFVHYQGQKYEIWGMGKGEGSEYEEFGGKLVNFRCELTDEAIGVRMENGMLGATSCVWDSIDKDYLK